MNRSSLLQPIIGGHLFNPEATPLPNPVQIAKSYHERTKHRSQRYAAGPDTLDWDGQPNPFRKFRGATQYSLPLSSRDFSSSVTSLFGEPHEPALLSLKSLGALLELSLALNAWKTLGPDRWPLRCAPSSGNLHPIEGYVISSGIEGLQDGLYHYDPQDHVLEHRARLKYEQGEPPLALFVGLSSIYWREAWKYGERAFRYTHLDLGHVIGSLCAAASSLGWQVSAISKLKAENLAVLLGTNRSEDFRNAEPECPEILLQIKTRSDNPRANRLEYQPQWAFEEWQGQANCLDSRPMYHWPVIDQIQEFTSRENTETPENPSDSAFSQIEKRFLSDITATQLIQQRRSAKAFDSKEQLPFEKFLHFLTLIASPEAYSDCESILNGKIHLILWIHRVSGMAPGLYLMAQEKPIDLGLKSALNPEFEWTPIDHEQLTIGLWKLCSLDNPRLAKSIHCHQAIASDAMLLIGCLSDFEPAIEQSSWNYRGLHWKTGMIGHRVYLSAESLGYRATGIGCYFDDEYHQLLGLSKDRYQALYHLAIGTPILDQRIESFPPYPKRNSEI